MAKKRAKKRKKTAEAERGRVPRRKVAQNRKTTARASRARPGRSKRCRALVVERDGAYYCRLPIRIGEVLGTTDDAPVRVTLAGVDFYSRAKGVHVTGSLLESVVPSPPNAIEFLLYKAMVAHVDPVPGEVLTVTIRREEYPPNRRGKRAE